MNRHMLDKQVSSRDLNSTEPRVNNMALHTERVVKSIEFVVSVFTTVFLKGYSSTHTQKKKTQKKIVKMKFRHSNERRKTIRGKNKNKKKTRYCLISQTA